LQTNLERMTSSIRHRGPDDVGYWEEPTCGIALGHRRLSIVDLSTEGHQPMHSAGGRYTMVFNGEVYNFRELRRELEQGPTAARFRGGSDTEVMLAAFEAWGVPAATRRFIGMFAFAVWDAVDRVVLLARDRLGIKPLYFGHAGGALVFGSELRALRHHTDFASEVDVAALGAFFQFGYVPTPLSIFKAARKLTPATIATFRSPAAEPTIERYWDAAEVARNGRSRPFRGTLDQATDELEALLSDAVRLRMIADVPLGAFLSGGIDSSLVTALMQRQGMGAVRTFSIGNESASYDESKAAEDVARQLGANHTAFRVTEQDALSVAPRLGSMYDEPFADSSQLPTYLVSHLARSAVTVALSGDGGDELFGGYNRHVWAPRVLAIGSRLPGAVAGGLAKGLKALSIEAWDQLYAKAGPLVPKLRLAGDKVHKLAGALDCRDSRALYLRLCSQWERGGDALAPQMGVAFSAPMADAPGDLGSFAAEMMYLDQTTYLPDDILTKVDRASMSVGLEARVPLLDHRVVEFAWRLPDAFKIQGNTGKVILRHLLGRYFPADQFRAPKMGFGVPVASWLRAPLRPWAEDLLSDQSLRQSGLLNPTAIGNVWSEHVRGGRDHSRELWTVLMFSAWLRDNAAPSM
jgi:asparagine synthase (glutamine-hydrolysing)